MSFPRALTIGLFAVALGGACGGSSTAATSDAGRDHLVSSSLLAGTINPGGPPLCITAPIAVSGGQAECTVVQHLAGDGGVTSTTLSSCDVANGPCWSLINSPASCPDGGLTFTFDPDPANPNPPAGSLSYDYSCVLGG
jgi:hypothetical protein